MKKGAKTLLLAKFHRKMEIFVPVRQIFANLPNMYVFILSQANEITRGHRIPEAKLQLSLPRLITFIGKTVIKIDADVCANVR